MKSRSRHRKGHLLAKHSLKGYFRNPFSSPSKMKIFFIWFYFHQYLATLFLKYFSTFMRAGSEKLCQKNVPLLYVIITISSKPNVFSRGIKGSLLKEVTLLEGDVIIVWPPHSNISQSVMNTLPYEPYVQKQCHQVVSGKGISALKKDFKFKFFFAWLSNFE